jgi:hypothetical protein
MPDNTQQPRVITLKGAPGVSKRFDASQVSDIEAFGEAVPSATEDTMISTELPELDEAKEKIDALGVTGIREIKVTARPNPNAHTQGPGIS